jgi:hypothetical protein
VGLKTVKGTKQLRLDPTIYEAMLKEKIVVGDVIYVECSTGAVKVCVYFVFFRSVLSFFRFSSSREQNRSLAVYFSSLPAQSLSLSF